MHANDFFALNGVSPLFTNELVAAATAVNYGTPVHEIHGLGALVSLAASGAVSVKGGNRKIFEAFVGASDANVRLGEGGRVRDIIKMKAVRKGGRAQYNIKTVGGVGGVFDVGLRRCSEKGQALILSERAGGHPRCALPPDWHPSRQYRRFYP